MRIILDGGQLEQFAGFVEFARDVVQRADDLDETRALAAQVLRLLGVRPDLGRFERTLDLGQPRCTARIVKDTPSEPRNGS
jgi:hypothetical protein